MTPSQLLWNRLMEEAPDDFDEEEYISSLNRRAQQDQYRWKNRQDFDQWMESKNLRLQNPSPVLRLEPKMPPLPRTYRGYEIEPAKPDPFHVWVGDRDKVGTNKIEGAWRRIGTPIKEEDVGRTTFGQIGEDKVYQPRHHNVNIAKPAHLSDDELRAELSELNLPTDGSRYDLYKRHINTATSELKGRLVDGHQPTNEELINIVNRDHDAVGQLQQANELRQERMGVQPSQQNPGLRQRWQQSNLNPTNWSSQANNPMRADGTQVSNAEANSLRQWGQQNLENQANNASMLNRLGTGSNPMTVNNLPGASAGTAIEGAAAPAATSGAAGMLGRAMPVISLALLANSFLQNSRANIQQKEDAESQQNMRI